MSADQWIFRKLPTGDGDCRKLVTLEKDGMTWVGIRAFDVVGSRWMNNNVSELAHVVAWQDLPIPAVKPARIEFDPHEIGFTLDQEPEPREVPVLRSRQLYFD